ncbi:MAG: acyltransferase [Blautia sp.]|nr:acyltransferase [Lachnoclostridium sp.]MCM1211126.1 acyltransferase [Blautia sp.]
MKKRKTNIELLRVLSMFLVIMIHLMTKTSVLWEMNPGQPVYYISWFLYALCMTGVNCYVLISGYFWEETKFRFEKLLQIYFQVLFYSITIALVLYACKVELKSSWADVFLPITSSEYWFATIYIGLYCFAPYLALIIQNMEEKPYRRLLLLLGVLFSVIPTFLHKDGWLNEGGAYGIVWFIYLYLIGGYLRKYYADGKKKAGWYYLVSILVIPLCKFAVLFVGRIGFVSRILREEIIFKISEIFYSFNALPALCASVFLFCFFCSVQIKNEKLAKGIQFTGGLTFGIYLVHNNRNLAHVLWEGVRINDWLVERENILAILGIWIGVFIVCGAVEFVRQRLFQWLGINTLIRGIAGFLDRVVRKALDFLPEETEQPDRKES